MTRAIQLPRHLVGALSAILIALTCTTVLAQADEEPTEQQEIALLEADAAKAYEKGDYPRAIQLMILANAKRATTDYIVNISVAYGEQPDCKNAVLWASIALEDDGIGSDAKDIAKSVKIRCEEKLTAEERTVNTGPIKFQIADFQNEPTFEKMLLVANAYLTIHDFDSAQLWAEVVRDAPDTSVDLKAAARGIITSCDEGRKAKEEGRPIGPKPFEWTTDKLIVAGSTAAVILGVQSVVWIADFDLFGRKQDFLNSDSSSFSSEADFDAQKKELDDEQANLNVVHAIVHPLSLIGAYLATDYVLNLWLFPAEDGAPTDTNIETGLRVSPLLAPDLSGVTLEYTW